MSATTAPKEAYSHDVSRDRPDTDEQAIDSRLADVLAEFHSLAGRTGDRTLFTLAEMSMVHLGKRLAGTLPGRQAR